MSSIACAAEFEGVAGGIAVTGSAGARCLCPSHAQHAPVDDAGEVSPEQTEKPNCKS